MVDNTVDPNQTTANWLYFRQFGEGYEPVIPPASVTEKLLASLRRLQKQLFSQEVQIGDEPDRLDTVPQSLAEILQQRLEAQPLLGQQPQISRSTAIKRGMVAGLVFMLLVGAVFLIKSLQ